MRQAEYSPELKQARLNVFVHSWLLNIVSDRCNQEQSRHHNEQDATEGRYLSLWVRRVNVVCERNSCSVAGVLAGSLVQYDYAN